jgi:hypothetical protein
MMARLMGPAPASAARAGMQVEGAMARAVENGLGQDTTGHDHRGIGAGASSEARLLLGAFEPRRRKHGEARSLGLLLHGDGRKAMPRLACRGGWV